MKKITISQAAAMLEAIGITLVRGLPTVLVDGQFVAQYEIEESGVRRVVTPEAIREILSH